MTEGGVIPATLVYLGGFYKSTELATRLAWFWGIQVYVLCTYQVFVLLIVIIMRCSGHCQCCERADGKWTTSVRRNWWPRRVEMVISSGWYHHGLRGCCDVVQYTPYCFSFLMANSSVFLGFTSRVI